MSNAANLANKEFPLYSIAESLGKIDEYNGNEIQYIRRDSFELGFTICQKEYEEKLRWISVEEKLPEKIQKYPYVSHVVQVRSIKYSEPLCAYYNHEHRVWLSYPFSNSAEILPVTDWRYFL